MGLNSTLKDIGFEDLTSTLECLGIESIEDLCMIRDSILIDGTFVNTDLENYDYNRICLCYDVLRTKGFILEDTNAQKLVILISSVGIPHAMTIVKLLMIYRGESRRSIFTDAYSAFIDSAFIDFLNKQNIHLNAVNKEKLYRISAQLPPPPPSTSMKRIQDKVHGLMEMDQWLMKEWVDSPVVQRLRNLKQLGACLYVYPNSTHSRFEHSLGVSYLAGKYFDRLCVDMELGTYDHDVKQWRTAAQIAGLLHDLGHGPFSHTFETIVNTQRDKKGQPHWHHEEMSLQLIEHMFATMPLDKYKPLKPYIIEMIDGKRASQTVGRLKDLPRAALDIVSNKKTGLDVDRFDYLMRDSFAIDQLPSFDVSRIFSFSRVLNDEICYDVKEAFEVHRVYERRHRLFKQMYTHRKVRAVEFMICDALIEIDSILNITECVEDAESYLNLNDSCFDAIPISLSSSANSKFKSPLQRAFEDSDESMKSLQRAVNLKKRIVANRDTYKFTTETSANLPVFDIRSSELNQHSSTPLSVVTYVNNTSPTKQTNADILRQADQYKRINKLKKKFPGNSLANVICTLDSSLSPDDICVDFNCVSLGTETEEPLGNVKFFQNNTVIESYDWTQAGLLPWATKTLSLRFFSRDASKTVALNKAARCFFQKNGLLVGAVDFSRQQLKPHLTTPPLTRRISCSLQNKSSFGGSGHPLFEKESISHKIDLNISSRSLYKRGKNIAATCPGDLVHSDVSNISPAPSPVSHSLPLDWSASQLKEAGHRLSSSNSDSTVIAVDNEEDSIDGPTKRGRYA